MSSHSQRQKKTREHTLTRVRNNQRRHRERRRQYITSLEERLFEAERLLADARATIGSLEAQLNELRLERGVALSSAETVPTNNETREGQNREDGIEIAHKRCNHASYLGLYPAAVPPAVAACKSLTRTSKTMLDDASRPSTLLPNFMDKLVASAQPTCLSRCCVLKDREPPFVLTHAVEDLHPPDITADDLNYSISDSGNPESTTLCTEAYALISQQNYRGLDADAIRSWLERGFRRGRLKGDGCRVETALLFSLLDFISGI